MRLRRLRETFGVDQKFIATLAGLDPDAGRVQVNKAEGDKIQWQSGPFLAGVARAFGMSYEQMASYLDGAMPVEDAIRIARPAIESERERCRSARTHKATLDRLLADAAKLETLAPGTEEVARHELTAEALAGQSDAQVVEWIRQVSRGIAKVIADTGTKRPNTGSPTKSRARATER